MNTELHNLEKEEERRRFEAEEAVEKAKEAAGGLLEEDFWDEGTEECPMSAPQLLGIPDQSSEGASSTELPSLDAEATCQGLRERLRKGKEAMAARCERVGMALAEEAGVKTWEYRRSLTGRAWAKRRHIRAPKPTTRRRLYIWAHECAHVALNHDGKKPQHRKEYEAERWAQEALRRHGISVPRKELTRAKEYVAHKIRQAERRGAKHIDAEARAWSKS
jgi:hypothetical protein